MKSFAIYITSAFLICGCAKKIDPPQDPTYLNQPMTEWARRATDVDEATQLSGLLALTHFDISSGTPQTIAMLRALAINQNASQDKRGAAIALSTWLDHSHEIMPDEIPLLFATLENHQDQLSEWRPLCNLASFALEYDHDHRARIIARARELRKHLWDRYFMDEILKAQAANP